MGAAVILQLRYNLPPEIHDHMQALGRAFVNGHLKFVAPPGNASAQADASALSRDGFFRLGKVLSNEQIMEIRAHFDPMPLMDSGSAETQGFRADAAPFAVNVAHFEPDTVITAPCLREVAMGPTVLPLVCAISGGHRHSNI